MSERITIPQNILEEWHGSAYKSGEQVELDHYFKMVLRRWSDSPDGVPKSSVPLLVIIDNEVEAIVCDAISGGADYHNDMPRSLYLRRTLKSGEEFSQRYVQQGSILEQLDDIYYPRGRLHGVLIGSSLAFIISGILTWLL